MPISVANPVSPAIERTTKILFRPFEISKWFVMGFCAFLAHLGEGGFGPNFNAGGGPGRGGSDSRQTSHWLEEHIPLLVGLALVGVIVGLAIFLLFTWLSSRGKFMFLDGIVHNRGAVVKPWKKYRREANSLFIFRVVFGLITLGFFLAVAGAALVLALPNIRSGKFGLPAGLALAAGIPSALLVALMSGVVNLFLMDMVVPVMYLRRLSVLGGWTVFREEFLGGRVGTFFLYILFKIVIGICVAMVTMLITCVTCCIAALPYIGTVILLPIFVFDRAYPLYFMGQFGPEWQFFRKARVMPVDEGGTWEEEKENGA